ncbi:MAG: HPr kinase/phosphorylase [Roseobacter sp.]
MNENDATVTYHASCVSVEGRGVLIIGASGRGKSALALQLIALGALLVSDDRTILMADGEALVASAPPQIKGLIEARGIGILNAEVVATAPICLVVDLDHFETARLPVPRVIKLLDINVPCLHKIDGAHFPAAILQYLKAGRQDQT